MAPTDPFYHTHVPAAHDPHVAAPYWGPSTSSVDWCEANYLHSQYVAEFWNTLSSLPLVGAMVYGLVKCHQHGIEWRFRLCYVALGLVGCGSVAFHATMTHAGQAADELAMIYGGLVFLWACLELEQRDRTWSKLAVPLAEAGYAVLFTAAYFSWPQYFGFFVAAYVALVALILKQTWRAYRRYVAEVGTAAGYYQRMLFRFSFGTYAFGFLTLWVPENALCPFLPVGLQWLNLHAWFHLTSTVAPYNLLVFLAFHRLRVLRRAAEHRFSTLAGVPVVVYVHALDRRPADDNAAGAPYVGVSDGDGAQGGLVGEREYASRSSLRTE